MLSKEYPYDDVYFSDDEEDIEKLKQLENDMFSEAFYDNAYNTNVKSYQIWRKW